MRTAGGRHKHRDQILDREPAAGVGVFQQAVGQGGC